VRSSQWACHDAQHKSRLALLGSILPVDVPLLGVVPLKEALDAVVLDTGEVETPSPAADGLVTRVVLSVEVRPTPAAMYWPISGVGIVDVLRSVVNAMTEVVYVPVAVSTTVKVAE